MHLQILPLLLMVGCAPGPQGATGPQGDQGPAGEDGPPGQDGVVEAALLGVNPFQVYQGTDTVVNVQGIGTGWVEGTVALHFGPGITVDDITVASPVSLLASIEVDKDAPTGPRDVEVSSGSVSLTWAGAFEVKPSIEVTVFGDAAQGSIFRVALEQKNPDAPAFSYSDTLTLPDGLSSRMYTYEGSTEYFDIKADVDAPTGEVPVTLTFGPSQSQTEANTSFELEARAATPIQFNTTTTGLLTANGGSNLYSMQVPAAEKVLSWSMTSDPVCAYYYNGVCQWSRPGARYYVLGESGKWDDVLVNGGYYYYGGSMIQTNNAQTLYLVVYELADTDIDVNYEMTPNMNDPFDPANDISVTWDPVDSGGQAHVDVTNSGAYEIDFGIAETGATTNPDNNEDCIYQWYYPYVPQICHRMYNGVTHMDLDYVEDQASVVSGAATLFDGGTDGDHDAYKANGRDRLTYVVWLYGGLSSYTCYTWGNDTSYYTNYGCTPI